MRIKRLILALSLALFLVLPVSHAEEVINYAAIYADVLDHFYQLVSNPPDEITFGNGETGVIELAGHFEPGEALKHIGYLIEDVSGDGIPELLIGSVPQEGAIAYGSEVYAAYTCADGVPSFVFEGRSRSSFRMMEGNRFFYQGSNGAIYSVFGAFSLSLDGTSLNCIDYYFTYEKDGNFEEIGAYHNTTGEWDPSRSKELDISLDDFWQIELDLIEQTRNAEFIPFSAYK